MRIQRRLLLTFAALVLVCVFTTPAFAAVKAPAHVSAKATFSWMETASHVSVTQTSTLCNGIICDGALWSSTCASTQTQVASFRVFSNVQPSRVLFVLEIFVSSGCSSAWGALANISGVTLTGVQAAITRSTDGVSEGIPGEPISLANPHSTSTRQIVRVSGATYTISGCAWDYGNADYECA